MYFISLQLISLLTHGGGAERLEGGIVPPKKVYLLSIVVVPFVKTRLLVAVYSKEIHDGSVELFVIYSPCCAENTSS